MTEHAEQVAVIEYARLRGWRTFVIPNGAHLYGGFRGWKRLHAEGVAPGVPDLFHPYPRNGYAGLFIELKHKTNKPSEAQSDWLDWLSEAGYLAVVYWGAGDAIETLNDYMGLEASL